MTGGDLSGTWPGLLAWDKVLPVQGTAGHCHHWHRGSVSDMDKRFSGRRGREPLVWSEDDLSPSSAQGSRGRLAQAGMCGMMPLIQTQRAGFRSFV